MASRRVRSRTAVEWLLTVVGAVSLGFYGYGQFDAYQFQRQEAAAFERLLASRDTQEFAAVEKMPAAPPPVPSAAATAATGDGAAVVPSRSADSKGRRGRAERRTSDTAAAARAVTNAIALIEVPRLKLSAVVLPGDDDRTLARGVGHLPDTPLPWEPGNSALAGHRDGVFRPLQRVRVGDEIRIRSIHGDLAYVVRETRIVTPDDLSVLAPTSGYVLTLITCYPFTFIGDAPERFIIRAERLAESTAPSSRTGITP